MNLLSFGFLALLVCLGGVIAFFADRLGRTLGKKRHSLFGLRPRHTAELLTVSAGIVIPLLTVLIVMATSADMRTVLTQGPQIVADRKIARAEIARLNRQGAALQTKNQSLGSQNAQAERRLTDLRKQLSLGKSVIADLQLRQSALAARVRASETTIREASRRVEQLRSDLRTASGKLGTTTAAFVDIKRRRDALQATFDTLSRQQKDLVAQNHSLDTENQTLAGDLDKLRPQVQSLEGDKTKLTDDIAVLRDTLAQNRQSQETARIELDREQTELNRVQSSLDFANKMLDRNLGATRTNLLVYSIGDEIARLPVEPRLTEAQAEDSVFSLMRTVRVEADSKGATDADLPPIRAGDRQVESDEQRRGIAREISRSGDAVVLVAYAAINSFKGEPVAVTIKTFRNPTIYRDGQAISEIRLDGHQSMEQIFQILNEFVATTVKAKALHDHMIPRAGADEAFGAVPSSSLLELAIAVKADDRVVRVTAYAHGTTRAADILNLDFRDH